jgi:hypothetical protein
VPRFSSSDVFKPGTDEGIVQVEIHVIRQGSFISRLGRTMHFCIWKGENIFLYENEVGKSSDDPKNCLQGRHWLVDRVGDAT